jgi:hypothetical protein
MNSRNVLKIHTVWQLYNGVTEDSKRFCKRKKQKKKKKNSEAIRIRGRGGPKG